MTTRIMMWAAASGWAMALAGCGGATQEAKDAADAAAAAAPAAGAPSAAPADEPAARAFVDRLFAAYVGDGEPDLFTKPDQTFEPELAAALAKLGERSEKTGTIEASQEADPICACQDYGDVSHSIDTLSIDGAKAKAVVSFTNFGETAKRRIDLVSTPGGWRIHDIDGTYRAAVLRDAAQP